MIFVTRDKEDCEHVCSMYPLQDPSSETQIHTSPPLRTASSTCLGLGGDLGRTERSSGDEDAE